MPINRKTNTKNNIENDENNTKNDDIQPNLNKMRFISGKNWKPSQPLPNDKHEMFCHEYVVDFNGSQAAIRAGYEKESARTQQWRLLKDENVSKRITYLKRKRKRKAKLSADWILEQIQNIAMDSTASKMIRLRALEDLGKHYAMFTDRMEVNERPKRIIVTDGEGNKVEELR